MNFLARLLREPLVHFTLIGAAVFAAYALLGESEDEPMRDRIVVTEGRIQQLAQVFAKTWQRPPTPQELRGLVDAFIKEEIYYREAVKLGLNRDDTLIRRRMQQKMEFLSEPAQDLLTADDATLQDYLDKHKEAYRVAPRLAFEQVFIRARSGDGDAPERAAETLDALKDGESPAELGDATLLPKSKPLSPLRDIERDFGDAFSEKLTSAPLDVWAGPIRSPYGLHLVRVTKRVDGYDPPLGEVRDAVLRDWRMLQREDHKKQAYETLRATYDVALPGSSGPKAQAEAQTKAQNEALASDAAPTKTAP